MSCSAAARNVRFPPEDTPPPEGSWPEDWIDPNTGERQPTMGKHRSGPYAKPIGYYEYDENRELDCWNCGWRGPAREGSRETYEELFDISCPRCERCC